MESTNDQALPEKSSLLLGEVLYADRTWEVPLEAQWRRLLAEAASGDAGALGTLYKHSHRAVFTLLMRLTGERETAEDLTLDVYHSVLGHAADFKPSEATVMAWIMNRARAAAIAHQRDGRVSSLHLREQERVLRSALKGLSAQERKAIEAVYFGELDYARAAAASSLPVEDFKRTLRAGLHELARGLSQRSDFPADLIFYRVCDQAELACAHVLGGLPAHETLALRRHLSQCSQCGWEIDVLRPVMTAFCCWPTDLLKPGAALQQRLADRIWTEGGAWAAPAASTLAPSGWKAVAPGISCMILAKDDEASMVSMLVRLEPGGEYPPHTHAAYEELHLLGGELWIDGRKLHPGDYNRAEQGSADRRVWSETGCTCVLVTSTNDRLS